MRTSFSLALTAATILATCTAAGAAAIDAASAQGITPANAIRVAANVCGNNGCYTPQVQRIQHRKFQPLGRPLNQPLGQPAAQSIIGHG
jgi:3-hydroxyisobutyrate dehydrogenase-like beta-hydroxyacid dehydrogenase